MKKLALAALLSVMAVASFGQAITGGSATANFSVTISPAASITIIAGSNLTFTVTGGATGASSSNATILYSTNCKYTLTTAISTYPTDGTMTMGTSQTAPGGALTLTGSTTASSSAPDGTGATSPGPQQLLFGLMWNGNFDTEAGNYGGGVVTVTITSP